MMHIFMPYAQHIDIDIDTDIDIHTNVDIGIIVHTHNMIQEGKNTHVCVGMLLRT
jgi:hypothetical protein